MKTSNYTLVMGIFDLFKRKKHSEEPIETLPPTAPVPPERTEGLEMEILYLKDVLRYPKRWPNGPPQDFKNYENVGYNLAEIEALEQSYNAGQPFPVVLREVLHLAGKSGWLLDGGGDNILLIYEFLNRSLTKNNRTIDRPFFCYDTTDITGTYTLTFLDEGPNPFMYTCMPSGYGWGGEMDFLIQNPEGIRMSEVYNNRALDNLEGRRWS